MEISKNILKEMMLEKIRSRNTEGPIEFPKSQGIIIGVCEELYNESIIYYSIESRQNDNRDGWLQVEALVDFGEGLQTIIWDHEVIENYENAEELADQLVSYQTEIAEFREKIKELFHVKQSYEDNLEALKADIGYEKSTDIRKLEINKDFYQWTEMQQEAYIKGLERALEILKQ